MARNGFTAGECGALDALSKLKIRSFWEFGTSKDWDEYCTSYLRTMNQMVRRGDIDDTKALYLKGFKKFDLNASWEGPIGVSKSIDSGITEEVRTTSSTGGEKGVKPQRYDLIPIGPLNKLAELYGKGAEKYADHNFRKGYEWSKSYAAAMRHMTAFWNGEDIDPEMGVPHVICASFHMFALAEFMETHPDFDDRYVPKDDDAE